MVATAGFWTTALDLGVHILPQSCLEVPKDFIIFSLDLTCCPSSNTPIYMDNRWKGKQKPKGRQNDLPYSGSVAEWGIDTTLLTPRLAPMKVRLIPKVMPWHAAVIPRRVFHSAAQRKALACWEQLEEWIWSKPAPVASAWSKLSWRSRADEKEMGVGEEKKIKPHLLQISVLIRTRNFASKMHVMKLRLWLLKRVRGLNPRSQGFLLWTQPWTWVLLIMNC